MPTNTAEGAMFKTLAIVTAIDEPTIALALTLPIMYHSVNSVVASYVAKGKEIVHIDQNTGNEALYAKTVEEAA